MAIPKCYAFPVGTRHLQDILRLSKKHVNLDYLCYLVLRHLNFV